MPSQDPLVFLQALLAKDFASQPHPQTQEDRAGARAPLVITLSRDYGSLGEEVAQRLAQCLEIEVFDQEILNRVSKRAKTDKFHFQGHDEQTSAALTSFLYGLISGTSGTLQDYRRHLGEVVADIARTNGIIIGRGAHLILGAGKAFRIRVVGSRLVCAQRIANEFKLPLAQAEQKVMSVNNQRHKSVVELYGQSFERCSLEYAENFDLTLNTDRISVDGAVAIIVLAIKEAGFVLELPRPKA